MITQKEKDELTAEIECFISSDFTSVDLVNFILGNDLAKKLLRKITYYEYDKELNYIDSADSYDIEYVLNKHHDEFYDPYYGSEDPITAFRLSKEDIEECETIEDLREYDNILSHLVVQLDEEPLEINLEEVLCKDNLDKLVCNRIDCRANQIYFFEEASNYFEFTFHYLYREGDGEWCCNSHECDVRKLDTIIDIDKYDNCCEAFEAYIAFFYNLFREEYCLNTASIEYISGSYLQYIKSSLGKSVYNGLNAIQQLRTFVGNRFLSCWCHLQEDKQKEIDELKGSWFDIMELHRETLDSVQRDGHKLISKMIKDAKSSEIWVANRYLHVISDCVTTVENRNEEIEQLKENVHELTVRLNYEKSKNEVLQLELKKKGNK